MNNNVALRANIEQHTLRLDIENLALAFRLRNLLPARGRACLSNPLLGDLVGRESMRALASFQGPSSRWAKRTASRTIRHATMESPELGSFCELWVRGFGDCKDLPWAHVRVKTPTFGDRL